jgi:outer membrane usher protein
MHAIGTLALLVLMAPAPAPAAAPAPADQLTFMSLIVNTVKKGEALVILRPKDVLVQGSALKAAGVRWQGGRSERIYQKVYVSLASLASDIVYHADRRAIVLRLTVKPSRLATTIIDLRPGAPRGMVFRQDTSGFFNYSLHTSDAQSLSSFNEVGLSFRGVLVYSGFSVSSQTWMPRRGQTRITIDQRSRLRRWTFGDNFVSTGALGGGVFLAGLSLARSFDINPYFVRHPMLGSSGVALIPSTLEVYVNNRLVRREALAPGPFQVKNVPVTSGAGTTRYVVRDAFGHQTEVSSKYYFSTKLLAKGLHDYSYAIGLRRNNAGTESLDYGLPVLVGRHRLGLLDWLTGEVRLECAVDTLSGGASVALRTPIGQVDASLAGSVARGGAGVAGLVSYAYNSRAFGVGVHLTAVSRRYATLSLNPLQEREMVEVGARASVSVGKRVSLQALYNLSAWHDRRLSNRLDVRVSATLHRRVSLAVSASRKGARPGRASYGLYASLHFSFGKRISGSASWRQRDELGEAEVQVHRPTPSGPGIGYRLKVAGGAEDQRVAGTFRLQNRFGRYAAHYDFYGGQSHLRTEAAGGVVAIVGGGVFATRPVRGGFALIRVPGVGGVRGYLNNQVVGRTNSQGNLLVTGLLPYYGNRLSIAPGDIPFNRSIGGLRRTVATSPRGGALVLFRAKQTHYYRGTIVVRRGQRDVIPAYGELTVRSGRHHTESPLGKKGEFELEDPRPGRATVDVVWAGGRCRMSLVIPASRQLVMSLGQIRCQEKGARK